MTWTLEIDARGLLCPLPVLKARKALSILVPGQVLRLLATDPAARIDLPHYCAQSGHILLEETVVGNVTAGEVRAYLIRCAAGGAIPAT